MQNDTLLTSIAFHSKEIYFLLRDLGLYIGTNPLSMFPVSLKETFLLVLKLSTVFKCLI